MAEPKKPRRVGRPTKLTPKAILTIAESLELCLPLKDCAESAGVTYETALRRENPTSWWSKGKAEYDRREKDPTRDQRAPRLTLENLRHLADIPDGMLPDGINDLDRLFLAFFEQATRANAMAKKAGLASVRLAGLPHTEKEVTTETRDVVMGRGDNRRVVTLTTTREVVRENVFDWRAAAWILERRWPEDFPSAQLQKLLTMDLDVEGLTTDELEAIIGGEDPLEVLARRRQDGMPAAAAPARDATRAAPPAAAQEEQEG